MVTLIGLAPILDRFSYHYSFHYQLPVCGLDYTFTISYDLGVPCLVSAPSLVGLGSGLAVKPSLNLRYSTSLFSERALNLFKSVASAFGL